MTSRNPRIRAFNQAFQVALVAASAAAVAWFARLDRKFAGHPLWQRFFGK